MEKVDSYCGFEQGVARNITKDSVTKNLTKPCKDDGENGERLVHHIYERFVQRVLMDWLDCDIDHLVRPKHSVLCADAEILLNLRGEQAETDGYVDRVAVYYLPEVVSCSV